MIFAKINPAASIVKQNGPFTTETVSSSYMTAYARPYALGAQKVNFQVSYGEVEFDASGSVKNFKQIFNSNVELSGSAITSWGTDDASILNAIAAQVGTTVVEVVSGSVRFF